MSGRVRVLELGSGSNALLDTIGPPGSVACDLSLDMLQQRKAIARTAAVVGAGEQLPFRSGAFDGMYHINVIEHVADVEAVIAEGARVAPGPAAYWPRSRPNGNWERWLDLAESWRMKIPEGPHTFLTTRALASAASRWFDVVEHRTFLACPGRTARAQRRRRPPPGPRRPGLGLLPVHGGAPPLTRRRRKKLEPPPALARCHFQASLWPRRARGLALS